MSNLASRSILLVDDEPVVARATFVLLKKWGYEVLLADSGEKAIQAVEGTARIDLILMDIDLGKGLSGYDAATRILGLRAIPVVFLSSRTDRETVEKARGIARYGYAMKDSSDFVLRSSIELALELFEAHREIEAKMRALQESEGKFSKVFENSPYPMMIIDAADGNFTNVNQAMVRNVGYSREELIGRNGIQLGIVDSELEARTRKRLAESGGYADLDVSIVTKDGATRLGSASGQLIDINGGKFILQTIVDVTAREKAERALRESEELHRSILNASPDAVALTDLEGRMLMFSPSASMMFGYERDEMPSGALVGDFLVPEDRARAYANISLMHEGVFRGVEEYRALRKDGTPFDVEINGEFVRGAEGRPSGMVFIVRDIGERKRAEDKIGSLLAEKELTLKEVHHRIKNNLGTVRSLLSLQARSISDPAAVAAFNDTESRVLSMLVLYEKLYLSPNFSDVNGREYLASLVDQIVSNFPKAGTVRVEKSIEDFVLGPKRLQCLGIIINELLTNIMKYAFPDRDDGLISVRLELDGNRAALMIRDDGCGIPESLSLENPPGFGLTLVKSLTAQLDGRIRIERKEGTSVVLEFDLDPAARSG
jgi:PAS domain S-box-containing protein